MFESELVQKYSENPEGLSGEAIIVSITEDSLLRQKETPILQKSTNGNYWIIETEERTNWLVPNTKFRINPHNAEAVKSLFQCQNFDPEKDREFILHKPARVRPLPDRNWQLKDQGILNFGDVIPEAEILPKIATLSRQQFAQVCQDIVAGFGFSQGQNVHFAGVEVAWQEKLSRESSDGMFRTEETWLIAFARPNNKPSKAENSWDVLSSILQAAQEARVENLLAVFFGTIPPEDIENYHATAKRAGIKSGILTAKLAADLAGDYASETLGIVKHPSFSFARLRERMQQQAREATWRTQFQSLTALPTRVKSGQTDSILDEADLFRAAFKSHSLLLLGEPGAGKTTSLQALAEELARVGGRSPILMPLNQYTGNLLADLGKTLCEGLSSLSPEDTLTLLSSGAFTVMLDGLNEVQQSNLAKKLVKEINQYTDPQHKAARCQWIVSGRKYDYRQDNKRSLTTLEEYTWELQPLTPDLI